MAATPSNHSGQGQQTSSFLLNPDRLCRVTLKVRLHHDNDDRIRHFLLPRDPRKYDESAQLFELEVDVFQSAEDEQAWEALPVAERIHQAYQHEVKRRLGAVNISVCQASEMSSLGFFSNLFSVTGWPHGWALSQRRRNQAEEVIATLPHLSQRESSPGRIEPKPVSLASFLRSNCEMNSVQLRDYLDLALKLDVSLIDDLSVAPGALTELLRRAKLGRCSSEFRSEYQDTAWSHCALEPRTFHPERAHLFPGCLSLQNFKLVMHELNRYCVAYVEKTHNATPGVPLAFSKLSTDLSSILVDWPPPSFGSHKFKNSVLPLGIQLRNCLDRFQWFFSIFDEKPVWLCGTLRPLSLLYASNTETRGPPLVKSGYRSPNPVLPALFANACRALYAQFATETLRDAMLHRAGRLVAAQRALLRDPPRPAEGNGSPSGRREEGGAAGASHSPDSPAVPGKSSPEAETTHSTDQDDAPSSRLQESLFPIPECVSEKDARDAYAPLHDDIDCCDLCYKRLFRECWVETGGLCLNAVPASKTKDEEKRVRAMRERQAALDILRLTRRRANDVARGYRGLKEQASSPSEHDIEKFDDECKEEGFDPDYVKTILDVQGVWGYYSPPNVPRLSQARVVELCRDYENAIFFSAWPLLLGKEQLVWERSEQGAAQSVYQGNGQPELLRQVREQGRYVRKRRRGDDSAGRDSRDGSSEEEEDERAKRRMGSKEAFFTAWPFLLAGASSARDAAQ